MPDDLHLGIRESRSETFERSNVLLAMAHFDGRLELLTCAWEKALGYGRGELAGKTLRQLMGVEMAVAAVVVAAILDQRRLDPVELSMRCRDGRGKSFKLHRHVDPHERAMFIVAEEYSPAG